MGYRCTLELIINKYKTIFVHIPKNAGTSVKRFFNKDRDDKFSLYKIDKHDTIHQIKLKAPKLYDSFKKFAIVRNPYDRMISWYFFLGFDIEFRKWIKNPTHKLESQYTWVDETVEILKFENLNDDLNKFFDEEINLPIINKSNHDHYLKYYDQESLDIVNDRYKEDFKKYNYKK